MLLPRRRLSAGEDPGVTVVPPAPGPIHWGLVLGALVMAGWLYAWLAGILVVTTNQNPLAQDQKNNMRQALVARATLHPDLAAGVGPAIRQWLPHQTDGVVAPLWPWVAARTAREGHVIEQATFDGHTPADLAFFERGKWLNVWMSGIFLAVVGVVVARKWTVLGTVNFVLLAMLGAVLPRAVTFQPEPLYYILFFLSWVVGMRLCVRNSLGGYVLFGFLCGLAGLAKSSIQPLMVVWFGVMVVRCGFAWWRPMEKWSVARHLIGVVMWAAVFLLVMAPRMSYGHERWGRPFFAYPNVWMWMDDFETGYAWMRQHPDRSALDGLSREQWPSLATYAATHSPEQMAGRLRDGLMGEAGTLRTFFTPKRSGRNAGTLQKPWKRLLEPRGWFLAGVAGAAAVGLGVGWMGRRAGERAKLAAPSVFGPEIVCQVLLVGGVVSALTLLYGWYTPVGRGDRFMLSLWMPLVFSLLAWAESAVRPLGWGVPRWTYTGAMGLLAVALLWRVSELVRAPFFEVKLL